MTDRIRCKSLNRNDSHLYYHRSFEVYHLILNKLDSQNYFEVEHS